MDRRQTSSHRQPSMTSTLVAILSCLPLAATAQVQFVEKMTSHGRVRGYLHEALPGQHVERYFGIPYAAPPVGELRFEPPQPPAAWSGVRNATELPPACWHDPANLYYIQEHRPGFESMAEDCLYVNLYVPVTAHALSLLPVLVHVHGGGNIAGMGAMLDGDVLAATGKIIVVNFNFRLWHFGFLGLGEEGFRGNFGLLDQVAALQWVKDNIHHFGGDPGHVTLQGHSAGGADVGLHVVSPLSRGLFRYAVLQSGFPCSYFGVEEAPLSVRDITLAEAARAGCMADRGAASIKDCLKAVAVEDFKPLDAKYDAPFLFFPIAVDGHFLLEHPDSTLRKGHISGESFLLGVTGDDGANPTIFPQFRLWPVVVRLALPPTDRVRTVPNVVDIVRYEYSPRGLLADNGTAHALAYGFIVGDSAFRAPGLRMADLISHRRPTYFYSFDYDSPLSPGVGVPHGADLFYLFGCPFTGHPYFNYSEEDRDVSSELMTLWANFVAHGSPRTRQGTQLSPYTNATLAYFRVVAENGSATVREDHALRAHQVALWNELLPRLAESREEDDVSAVRMAGNDSDTPCLESKVECENGTWCHVVFGLTVSVVLIVTVVVIAWRARLSGCRGGNFR